MRTLGGEDHGALIIETTDEAASAGAAQVLFREQALRILRARLLAAASAKGPVTAEIAQLPPACLKALLDDSRLSPNQRAVIVMGSHGRTGLDRILHGSVTASVTHHAPCSVLVLPPRQSDGFENKYRFVRYIEQIEGKQIINVARQDRQPAAM